MEYKWSTEAYAKVVFHSCKYLTHPLSGLLLGDVSNGAVSIIDCIPLSHAEITSPATEIALIQIDDFATKAGLKIVGIYTAPSTITNAADDSNITQTISKIANKIKQFFDHAFIFVVNEAITQSSTPAPAGKMFISDKGGWGTLARHSVVDEKTLETMIRLAFSAQMYRDLVDFSDSLDDPSKDWTNASIFPQNRSD